MNLQLQFPILNSKVTLFSVIVSLFVCLIVCVFVCPCDVCLVSCSEDELSKIDDKLLRKLLKKERDKIKKQVGE